MLLPFEDEYRNKYYKLLDKVFDSNFWSEGKMVKEFEEKFSEFTGVGSRSVTNGGTGLLAIFEYLQVKGCDVIIPTNTFWATTIAAKKAGANVIYADCNKEDLCLSYTDMIDKVTPQTKAIVVVHIGGHIAFEIEKITKYCEENNIFLIEDCAHAHGATWNGRATGSWGFAGSYSFYSTKTMPLGEGGMVVSRNAEFLKWLDKYRNYGKTVENGKVSYSIENGFNYRMSEISAALGIIQLERLPLILKWKQELAKKYNALFKNTVYFPEGMISGYYKYIVFDYNLNEKTGKVFSRTDFGNVIDHAVQENLPNSEWIAAHHECPPIYYGWEYAGLSIEELGHHLLGVKK